MTLDIVGRLDQCFLLSYAVDADRAAALLPAGVEPVTHRGCAFLNIVACRIDAMRPRFSPRGLGVTSWHVAYRIQVRASLSGDTSIQGLYFLRSDVDSRIIRAIGNRLTDFRFHATPVRFLPEHERWNLQVDDPHGAGSAILCAHRAATHDVTSCSPFSSIEERERFLKYVPFGLSVSRSGRHLRIAEVRRDETLWREDPVRVETGTWKYPPTIGLNSLQLVRATRVSPIDYIWRIGRVEDLLHARP
jgi:Uncharacterized conserved protein (COG2071)